MKNTIRIFLFLIVVTSCASNKEKNPLRSFYQNSFNEIKENWTISSDDKYFITIQSKPYQLNSYNDICAMKYFALKKDKQLNVLPLYEQLVNSQVSTFYSLNKDKANCSSIPLENYFYISDINNSDDANYGIFEIASIVLDKKWFQSNDIEYHDEVSKACLNSKNKLLIESVHEREFTVDNELYVVNLSCMVGKTNSYVQLLVNNNLEENKFEYSAIEVSGHYNNY